MTDAGLGGVPGGAEVLAADGARRGVLVDERVVEEAEPELHREQAPGRRVDARLGDPALRHEVEQHVDALLAAELVGAGVEDALHPLVRVEVLDAPGAGRQHLVADVGCR